jgi:hypothetical protein
MVSPKIFVKKKRFSQKEVELLTRGKCLTMIKIIREEV